MHFLYVKHDLLALNLTGRKLVVDDKYASKNEIFVEILEILLQIL